MPLLDTSFVGERLELGARRTSNARDRGWVAQEGVIAIRNEAIEQLRTTRDTRGRHIRVRTIVRDLKANVLVLGDDDSDSVSASSLRLGSQLRTGLCEHWLVSSAARAAGTARTRIGIRRCE